MPGIGLCRPSYQMQSGEPLALCGGPSASWAYTGSLQDALNGKGFIVSKYSDADFY